jgi:hypothetical protein
LKNQEEEEEINGELGKVEWVKGSHFWVFKQAKRKRSLIHVVDCVVLV